MHATTNIDVNEDTLNKFYKGIQLGISSNDTFSFLTLESSIEVKKGDHPIYSFEASKTFNDLIEFNAEYSLDKEDRIIDTEFKLKASTWQDSYVYVSHSYEIKDRVKTLNINFVHYF